MSCLVHDWYPTHIHTYPGYVEELLSKLWTVAEERKFIGCFQSRVKSPPPLSSNCDYVLKSEAIAEHKSRFSKISSATYQ